jgi:hypothetical protein
MDGEYRFAFITRDGEFIDRDNVTASFGVVGSASYVVSERGRRPW